MEPKALCDMNYQIFEVRRKPARVKDAANNSKSLAQTANVSYDHFIRTTDANHKDAVRYFWVRDVSWALSGGSDDLWPGDAQTRRLHIHS